MAAENVTIEHDVENLTINGRVTRLIVNGEVIHLQFGPGPQASVAATAALVTALRPATRHKLPDAFFDGPNGLNAIHQENPDTSGKV